MATKKNTRSSKTDHVLSLLSNSSAQEPVAEEAPAVEASSGEAPATAAAPAATPTPTPEAAPSAPQRLSPPILEVARTNNEALEATIHQALEAALEEDISVPPASEPMPQQPPAVPPEPVSVPVPEVVSEAAVVPEPVSLDEPAPIVEPDPLPVFESTPEPVPTAVPTVEPEPERIPEPAASVPEPTPEPKAATAVIPQDPEEAARKLHELAGGGYAVVYITEKLAAELSAVIEKYRERVFPAIILIPGVSGNTGRGVESVRKSVEQAVGSDILFSK